MFSLRDVDRLGDVKSSAGFTLVAADVELLNTGKSPLKYGPKLFRIKEATGQEAEAVGRKFPGVLTVGELKPGEKVRGLVAFEVRSTTGLTITYSGGKAPLPVKLTR